MRIGGILLSVVVFVVALWPDLIGATASKWVIVVIAVVWLLKSLVHPCYANVCGATAMSTGAVKGAPKAKAKAKAKKKKRR